MIRLLSLASFLAFAWTLSVYADERPSGVPSEARWVKVNRVTDGDTIVLMDRTRVRLHGIDAPEQDQPYGSAATKALERMVNGSVYIVEVDDDRYGRLVGQLYHSKEGYDINASMLTPLSRSTILYPPDFVAPACYDSNRAFRVFNWFSIGSVGDKNSQ